MSHNIKEIFEKQKQNDIERAAKMFVENARNAMRAVKIAIEEGDEEEAILLINEALGKED